MAWTDALQYLRSHTNRPLQTQADVAYAEALLREAALPLHGDWVKNWDNYLVIADALLHTDPHAPVLDAGADMDSPFLRGLAQNGFTDLTGINLLFDQPVARDGVQYQYGDITQTDFADQSFAYVACISVIEHGVDAATFFAEMARILRPGGRLFVSTDYWPYALTTEGRTAFDVPVKIFDHFEIAQMTETARAVGLAVTSGVHLGCTDRVVNWIGLDYTFINLVFDRVR